ncbi:tape measure domain protein [Bacteroidales bacterium Barb6XT]|nr:tape measure domain protein [Bacteroidales bacterium Barb6XT]
MPILKFKIEADVERVVQLRREIERLQATIVRMEVGRSRREVQDLMRQLGQAQGQLAAVARQTAQTTTAFNGFSTSINKTLGALGGIAAIKSFGSAIISTRAEMQMLETSFQVLLGNKGKADEMFKEIKQFAVDSPLSMSDVAGGAKTLLGFNVAAEKVMPTLKAIGDISMGNSQSFNSLTLAFAQMSATGKLMGQDLNQMINAGFNPLQEISLRTGKSISALKDEMSKGAISADMVVDAFRSATAEGAKTITGAQAQLEGAVQDMLNNLGKASESYITSSYKGAQTLVENYETVGRVLVGLIATYGTYKAALMLAIALENARAANLLSLAGIIDKAKAAQIALNTAIRANPYALAATLIMGVVAALWALKSASDEVEKSIGKVNDIKNIDEINQKIDEQKKKVEELGEANKKNGSYEKWKRLEAEKKLLTELIRKQEELITVQTRADNKVQQEKDSTHNKEYWNKRKETAESALASMDVSLKGTAEWNKHLSAIAKAQSELDKYDTKGRGAAKAGKEAEKRVDAELEAQRKESALENDRLSWQHEMEQKRIDLMNDSFAKQTAQNDLNFEKEKLQIKKQAKERLKDIQDAERKEWEAAGKPGGVFKPTTVALSGSDEQQFSDANDAAKRAHSNTEFKISDDTAKMYAEERDRFKDNLTKELADIDEYYRERIKKAEGNEALIAELRTNSGKAVNLAISKNEVELLNMEHSNSMARLKLTEDEYILKADFREKELQEEIRLNDKIIEELEKRYKDSPTAQLAKDLEAARIAQKRLNREIKKMPAEKMREVADKASDIFNSVGKDLTDIFENVGIEVSDDIRGAVSGLGQQLEGMAEMDITKPMTIITGGFKALSGLTKTIGSIFGISSEDSKLLKQIGEYENLIGVLDKLIDKQKTLLSDMTGSDAVAQEKKIANLIEVQQAAEKERMATWGKTGAGVNHHSMAYRFNRDQSDILNMDWEKMLGLNAEDWEGIQNDIDIWPKLWPEVQKYAESVISAGDAVKELGEAGKEALTGLSFNELQSSLDGLVSMADMTFEDISDSFESHMQKAILRMIQDKVIKDDLEKWYEDFAAAATDGIIDAAESGMLSAEYERIARKGNDAYKQATGLAVVGNVSKEGQVGSKGAFAAMSQDTGSELNGRFTALQMSGEAIRINTGEIRNISDECRTVLVNSFLELRQISENTSAVVKPIKNMEASMAQMVEVMKNKL